MGISGGGRLRSLPACRLHMLDLVRSLFFPCAGAKRKRCGISIAGTFSVHVSRCPDAPDCSEPRDAKVYMRCDLGVRSRVAYWLILSVTSQRRAIRRTQA